MVMSAGAQMPSRMVLPSTARMVTVNPQSDTTMRSPTLRLRTSINVPPGIQSPSPVPAIGSAAHRGLAHHHFVLACLRRLLDAAPAGGPPRGRAVHTHLLGDTV